jgi:hypothetical protein
MPYDWVTILSALLTPTIAIAGGVIALLQWRTAEKKRKQELFDKRFAVFESARNLLQEVQLQGNPSHEALRAFAIGTSGAEFLFNDKVGRFLKELGSRASHVRRSEARAERMPDGAQRNRVIDDAADQGEWLLQQASTLETMVKPFLQIT